MGLTSGEDRYDLASTEITDCADEALSPELWVLYGFAVGEELGCEVKMPSGARFSIDDKDDAYETGAAGIAGAGVGHTFRNVSIVQRDSPSWPPSSMPTPAPIDYCGATPSYTIDGVGDMIRIMSRGNLLILSLSIIFWCFRQVRLVSFFVSSLFVPDAERAIVLA